MNDMRVSIEEANNSLLALRKEVNDLKVEVIKLLSDSKVERSDRLYTAKELKKEKLGGIGDAKFQEMLDNGLPQTITSDGAHPKYSDKAVDEWIASKQVSLGGVGGDKG